MAPLALWSGAALCLVVAGGLELDAYRHQRALDDGDDYEGHRSAGIRSQNVARVTGAVGLMLGTVGTILYLVRDGDTAIAPALRDVGQGIVARF